jgi:adenylylsulfate kinase
MIAILVFGLSGSGKTTFAKKLTENTTIPHFNADEIRGLFKDWDFSPEGRLRQVSRMFDLYQRSNKTCVIDFICPYDKYRKDYDITVWMNTILNSKYKDTDKIFEKPKKVDYEIKDFNYNFVIAQINKTI